MNEKKQAHRSYLRTFQKPTFVEAVYTVVRKIPKGKTMSYGEVARRAGYPGAARAVGTAMKNNPDNSDVPCHRVVLGSGRVGEFAFGGKKKKIARLRAEGVPVRWDGKLLKKA